MIVNPEYRHIKMPFKVAANNSQIREYILTPRSKLTKSDKEVSSDSVFQRTAISKEVNSKLSFYKKRNFLHMLNYMFFHMGMGVYVMIKDNQVAMFVPFANMGFKNNWSDSIRFKRGIHNIDEFNKKHNIRDKVFVDPEKWTANNCLIGNQKARNGWPFSAGRLITMKRLLDELCKKHTIKDVEFFLNKRDFPVLKKDLTEPYHHIVNSKEKQLKQHRYDSYIPIFSMCSSPEYADIMFPTDDDISLYFNQGSLKDFDKIKKPKWETKQNIAMFRGTATGCGVTPKDNQRLKLAKLSKKLDSLDAKITSWNRRPKKIMGGPVDIIDPESLSFSLGGKVSLAEQMKYKYLVQVDGHVAAFRLSWMLQSGSTILMVKSWDDLQIWFQPMMKPWKHYVPIKANLSDLKEQLEWCQNNDSECKKMAENCQKLYEKYAKRSLDYLSFVLNKL